MAADGAYPGQWAPEYAMKILFLIGATSRIRNFHGALTLLAERGHTIQLTGRLRKGSFDISKSIEHERISGRVNPTVRADDWRDVVDLLRGARDYVRYFDPRYSQATRLVRRAYEIAPTEFVLYCERHPWVKRRWALASKALAWAEELVPSDPGFETFLREERPDIVVVTPLVTFESYQTDYVKAAHRLGVPVVFVPFSWDNLTNKGLMRVQPDRVLVWNTIQRQEAIDLHGCPADRVLVVGAARFDDFFQRAVTASRSELFAEYGLDPERPMVLYLGSSQLTGPNEMELVRRWVESIRASEDEVVRTCGILIRPHPALKSSWASVDFSGLGCVGVSLHARRDGDQELYDSLHHSHAAVGLNTSAMLEAAIVGRPVHTLVIPGFDAGQVGTMHFHYLVEAFGGLATVARDLAEHERQLSTVLRGAPTVSSRSRAFAEQFLRPHGAAEEVSPLLASEIERAASIGKTAGAHAPLWQTLLRRPLLTWMRRKVARPQVAEDTSIIATSMSLRIVRTALEEIQQGSGPVFVGPWVDSSGLELLYWIPFLRWIVHTYGLKPERLMVLSCGGERDWYGPLAHRHLDARTLFSPEELERWTSRTVPQSEQDPKQAVISSLDQEIVDRAVRAFDISDHQLLHPWSFFRVLRRLQKDRALEKLGEILTFDACEPSSRADSGHQPGSYVAVAPGFTPALPQNDENQGLMQRVLAELSAGHAVLVVDGPPAQQTTVLSRAKAFVGAYGDLAILAAACGTPATAYYSERLPLDQVETLGMASASGKWGTVTLQRARGAKALRASERMHA